MARKRIIVFALPALILAIGIWWTCEHLLVTDSPSADDVITKESSEIEETVPPEVSATSPPDVREPVEGAETSTPKITMSGRVMNLAYPTMAKEDAPAGGLTVTCGWDLSRISFSPKKIAYRSIPYM